MTTDRQREANRANSRRSTGPKTVDGKRRSSVNARRHGLTAPLAFDAVQAWYCLILDDPDAVPDPFESDAYLRTAYQLAEAEAQLSRVRLAEEAYLANPGGDPSEAEQQMREERGMIREALEETGLERGIFGRTRRGRAKDIVQSPREYESSTKQGERLFWRVRELEERAARRRMQSASRQGRLLARYRAAAEARRHKALRRWIGEITKRSQLQPKVA